MFSERFQPARLKLTNLVTAIFPLSMDRAQGATVTPMRKPDAPAECTHQSAWPLKQLPLSFHVSHDTKPPPPSPGCQTTPLPPLTSQHSARSLAAASHELGRPSAPPASSPRLSPPALRAAACPFARASSASAFQAENPFSAAPIAAAMEACPRHAVHSWRAVHQSGSAGQGGVGRSQAPVSSPRLRESALIAIRPSACLVGTHPLSLVISHTTVDLSTPRTL